MADEDLLRQAVDTAWSVYRATHNDVQESDGPVSTASGSIACLRMKGSKATSSIQPQLRHPVGAGGRRLTRSTVRRWFARCWRTSAANHECAQWSRRRL